MTIRSKMLLLLLPPLIVFLILISGFFYLNWSQEIMNSFKSELLSIVTTTSQTIQPEEVDWLIHHIHDPHVDSESNYLQYYQQLSSLKQKLPISNIYIVQVVPVKPGEYVLSDSPEHPLNQVYEGNNPLNAYRQVMLLDVAQNKPGPLSKPGETDFSETNERQIYITKKGFVTPIYETRKNHERMITAYAPIINKQGEVLALIGADVGIKEIDQKLNNALLAMGFCNLVTFLCIVLTVFFIADRISKPVRQLNQGALGIAAGNYETNIKAEGPREVIELANTLNTMSECLVEHMTRLKESALIRERMYGEYECALLLQHYMLQKEVESFSHPSIRMQLISSLHSPLQKGLLLKIDRTSSSDLTLSLLEAQEQGFPGLFHLNQFVLLNQEQIQEKSFTACQFSNQYATLYTSHHRLPPPLVWSMQSQRFLPTDKDILLQNQDMIFLFNSSFLEQFETDESIQVWFGRVLRHFSKDGLDAIHTMLTNELNFLTKKQQTKRCFQVISLQINMS